MIYTNNISRLNRIKEIEKEIEVLNKEKDSHIHENNRLDPDDKINQFFHSYSGKRLSSKYDLTHYSTWTILGEDTNCDLGGSHHQPNLGTVEGTLYQAIKHAVYLPGFWAWGSGGDIKETVIEKLKITKLS
jgi:hypothetical protein